MIDTDNLSKLEKWFKVFQSMFVLDHCFFRTVFEANMVETKCGRQFTMRSLTVGAPVRDFLETG